MSNPVDVSAGGKAAKMDVSPVIQIYQNLCDSFALGDNEVFQMEFPARILERGTYDYEGSDTINAQQIKPQTVVDAEFRLADDMYDVSNFVGGPNGVKVATQYGDILFGLVPRTDPLSSATRTLHEDQDKICAWLTEAVDDFTPPVDDILKDIPDEFRVSIPDTSNPAGALADPNVALDSDGVILANPQTGSNPTDINLSKGKICRVDLYQKLLNIYENERFRWASFKRNARPKDYAAASPADIDNFNRMLATFAPIVDSKLEALWTVLLVRGQYHRVRRFIGYVDMESASEMLQRAKENLRASVMRSIDDTQDVYPVYFEPANWAKYLSTAFTPEDLLSSESVVRNMIYQKQKDRSVLLLRQKTLEGSGQDIAAAQAIVDEAATAWRAAQTELLGSYSDTAVKTIEIFFDAYIASQTGSLNATAALSALDQPAMDSLNTQLDTQGEPKIKALADFKSLVASKVKMMQNQSAYEVAAERLARAEAAAATARASDTSTALLEVQQRILSLTLDIDYLTETLKKSPNATDQPVVIYNEDPNRVIPVQPPNGTPPTSIQLPLQDIGASIWTEIVLDSTRAASADATYSTSFSSVTNWNVGLFFASASGSDRQSSAKHLEAHNATNTTVTVGFRAMKVVVNRPWFDAGLFRHMQDFCRSGATLVSSSDPGPVRTCLGFGTTTAPDGTQVRNTARPGDSVLTSMNKCSLPTWPKAFIVVKDVHIIFEADQDFDSSFVSDAQRTTTNGGGFLCFSAGKSESSSEHRTAAAITQAGNTMSIKIPAPQIIGWISEITPKDSTSSLDNYTALDSSEFRDVDLGS